MMSDNQQKTVGSSEPMQPTSTNVRYPTPSNVTTGTEIKREPKPPVVETQKVEVKPQSEGDRMNPTLSRALMGGLIGATLGIVAGALAGRKTTQGITHAKQGVGRALKTMGEGLSQTGKGMGDAAKSVAEGVSYAVVGGTVEAAQGITDGAKQISNTTAEVVQSATESVSQTVQSATQTVAHKVQDIGNSIQETSEQTKQSVVDAVESDKAVSQDEDSVESSLRELQDEVDIIFDVELEDVEVVNTPKNSLNLPSNSI